MPTSVLTPGADNSDGGAVAGPANDGVSSSHDAPECAFSSCDESAVPGSVYCGVHQDFDPDGSAAPASVTGNNYADGTGRSKTRKPRYSSWRSQWNEGELRVVGENDEIVRVFGLSIVYSPWATIYGEADGPFRERVLKSAVDSVIDDGEERFLLYQHDWAIPPLASTTAGNLFLKSTQRGLQMAANLDAKRPLVQDIASAIKTGSLRGQSFAFRCQSDVWSSDMTQRTITKFASISEVTLTPTPAYPTTTLKVDARARALAKREQLRRRGDGHRLREETR